MRAAIAIAAAMLAAGCTMTASKPRPVVAMEPAPAPAGWRAIIGADDLARIDALPQRWSAARAAALPRYRAALEEAGPLLAADGALEHPALPPGSYNCRLISVGRERPRDAPYRAFAPFFCYVRGETGGALTLTKQTGTDLPGGWLHPDGERRYVFLGARQRRPGDNSLAYGADADRDLAGVVERVAPFRWRLVIPSRRGAGAIDVYELTPVPAEQQVAEPTPAP